MDMDPASADLGERLSSPDADVRRIALAELADLEDESSLPAIVDVLKHDAEPVLRRDAALRLATWERPQVVRALCEALSDPDSEVRDAAAHSLSELKDPATAGILFEWAGHDSPAVRAAVMRGLRELRCDDAFPVASALLGDADPRVRFEAIGVLGWLKRPESLEEIARLAAADEDPEVRRAATGALGFASDDAVLHDVVLPALLNALGDASWQVREKAAATLGKLGQPTAVDALVDALKDDYWQVRLRAARSLGRLRQPKTVGPLIALLAHAVSNLRKEVALALGEIGDRSAREALHGQLHDPDPDVRKSVLLALRQIG